MRNFIIGLLVGVSLSTGLSYAAMSGNKSQREYDKFIESADGKTAILAVIVE